ncbi:MAG: DMT family transporter [candidate division NC10 bacterium]
MSPLALSLVIASALFHAVWNLHAKQSEDKLLFLWGMLCVGSLLFLPVLIVGPWPNLPQQGWGYILGSGAIHAAYYFFLAEAYERGDLSLVYPLARGSSPLLVVVWAFLLIGEQPSGPGLLGIGSIVLGLLFLHWTPGGGLDLLRGPHVPLALLTGVTIASYSTVDKVGVALVHPVPYLFYFHLVSFLLLAPWIITTRGGRRLFNLWQRRGKLMIAGGLQYLAYVLVLSAMTLAKVSYVVATREVNVIFGAVLGAWWLREGYGQQKFVASALVAVGLVVIGRLG